MKKILSLLFAFISISLFSQVKIGGAISQTSTADNYPTHTDTTQYGGFRVLADTFARNNLKSSYRKTGMTVYCTAQNKTYQLVGGISNSNWAVSTGGGMAVPDTLKSATTVTIYADSTTGNDITGNGTIGLPFKTLYRALQSIAPNVKVSNANPIIIQLGVGTYDYTVDCDYILQNINIRQYNYATSSNKNLVSILGTMTATGITNTFTQDATDLFKFTASGTPTWTINQYRNYFVRPTNTSTQYFPIDSNSANEIWSPRTPNTTFTGGIHKASTKITFNATNQVLVGNVNFTNIDCQIVGQFFGIGQESGNGAGTNNAVSSVMFTSCYIHGNTLRYFYVRNSFFSTYSCIYEFNYPSTTNASSGIQLQNVSGLYNFYGTAVRNINTGNGKRNGSGICIKQASCLLAFYNGLIIRGCYYGITTFSPVSISTSSTPFTKYTFMTDNVYAVYNVINAGATSSGNAIFINQQGTLNANRTDYLFNCDDGIPVMTNKIMHKGYFKGIYTPTTPTKTFIDPSNNRYVLVDSQDVSVKSDSIKANTKMTVANVPVQVTSDTNTWDATRQWTTTNFSPNLTFGNGLTRSTNAVSLGGTLTTATNIATNGNKLTTSGADSVRFRNPVNFKGGTTFNRSEAVRNVMIGGDAGNTAITGVDNVLIGASNTGTNITTASRVVFIGDSITSNSGTQSNVVSIGHKSQSNTSGVSIGSNTTGVVGSTVIGASAIGGGTVTIGNGARTINAGIAIGYASMATAGVSNGKGSIALGNNAIADSGQFVVGSVPSFYSGNINEVIIGRGNTSASPNIVTHRNTNASGTNITGANLIYQASRGTGTGVGGSLLFQTSSAGTTGSTLNPAITRLEIRSDSVVSLRPTNIRTGLLIGGTNTAGGGSLNINGGVNGGSFQIFSFGGGGGTTTGMTMNRSGGGTFNAPTNLSGFEDMATIYFNGYRNSGYRTGAVIRTVAGSSWGDADYSTNMIFRTVSNGSVSLQDRISIDNTGKVGVGNAVVQDSLFNVKNGGHFFGGLRVNGDVNLPTGSNFRINGVAITGGGVTASNGLTLASSNITLGGTLTNNTIINTGASNTFEIYKNNLVSGTSSFKIDNSSMVLDVNTLTTSSRSSYLKLDESGYVQLRISQPTLTSYMYITFDSTGFRYNENYASRFTNRSLPDKHYVDSAITANVVSSAYFTLNGSTPSYDAFTTPKCITGMTLTVGLLFTRPTDSTVVCSTGGAGYYNTTVSGEVSLNDMSITDVYFYVYVNSTLVQTRRYTNLYTNGYMPFSLTCQYPLVANDVVKIKYKTNTTGVNFVTVGDLNVSTHKIGL